MELKQLKDLLNLIQPEIIKEDEDDEDEKSLSELVDEFINNHKLYSWEGSRGQRNFEQLIGVMGYSNLEEFLHDNPGCIEAMVDWIKGCEIPDWKDALEEDAYEFERERRGHFINGLRGEQE